MSTTPAGISKVDWLATPVGARAGFLELASQIRMQQQENDQLRHQLTELATEPAELRERIERNSSEPPSSDDQGFKPPIRRKGSGRKRGGQHKGILVPGQGFFALCEQETAQRNQARQQRLQRATFCLEQDPRLTLSGTTCCPIKAIHLKADRDAAYIA